MRLLVTNPICTDMCMRAVVVRADASLLAEDNQGRIPLFQAAVSFNSACAELLVQRGSDYGHKGAVSFVSFHCESFWSLSVTSGSRLPA